MRPNSTLLYIFISTLSNANDGVAAPALPMNETTNIKVEAFGKEVFIFYNSSLVALSTLNDTRISGNATVLISDPWTSPAKAAITSISLTSISSLSSRPIANYAGPLAKGIAYEKTYVPEDFALAFNITPNRLLLGSGSIIHYTHDNSNGARIPGRCLLFSLFFFSVILTHIL